MLCDSSFCVPTNCVSQTRTHCYNFHKCFPLRVCFAIATVFRNCGTKWLFWLHIFSILSKSQTGLTTCQIKTWTMQYLLCPPLLKSTSLLSFCMEDGRAPMGLPLADALQYAWLMGWGSLRWPRCLRTSYKLLGNCVAPIHTKIVTVAVGFRSIGWINLATSNFCGMNFVKSMRVELCLHADCMIRFRMLNGWYSRPAKHFAITLSTRFLMSLQCLWQRIAATFCRASLSTSSASPVANCLTKQNDILMMRPRWKCGTRPGDARRGRSGK